jgi:tetratricopeptide (TPR) repeat protein
MDHNRRVELYAILSLIIAVFGCIASYLALPEIRIFLSNQSISNKTATAISSSDIKIPPSAPPSPSVEAKTSPTRVSPLPTPSAPKTTVAPSRTPSVQKNTVVDEQKRRDAEGFLILGDANYGINLDQALADYSKAIELDPKFGAAYSSRGRVYHEKGDLDEALADYCKAIELDPNFEATFVVRGGVYHEKGDLDEALADYSKAIELDSKYAVAYTNRGGVYYEKGNFDEALADYSKVIELDPKYAVAYINRGLVYHKKGLKSQAIADYTTYLRLRPDASNRSDIEQVICRLSGGLFLFSHCLGGTIPTQ